MDSEILMQGPCPQESLALSNRESADFAPHPEPTDMGTSNLIDRILSEQDRVLEQLDSLDAQILAVLNEISHPSRRQAA